MKCLPWILIILASLIFLSCGNPKTKYIVDDGCEYVSLADGDYTHKGNCSNPIHYFKNDETIYKYNIVLPRDYSLITTDKNHPDSLLAYASQDTIYLFNEK